MAVIIADEVRAPLPVRIRGVGILKHGDYKTRDILVFAVIVLTIKLAVQVVVDAVGTVELCVGNALAFVAGSAGSAGTALAVTSVRATVVVAAVRHTFTFVVHAFLVEERAGATTATATIVTTLLVRGATWDADTHSVGVTGTLRAFATEAAASVGATFLVYATGLAFAMVVNAFILTIAT